MSGFHNTKNKMFNSKKVRNNKKLKTNRLNICLKTIPVDTEKFLPYLIRTIKAVNLFNIRCNYG